MKRKYSIALLCILTVSVLLLSVSYSAYSGTISEEEKIQDNQNMRIKYSNTDKLNTINNKETDIAITNLLKEDKDYVIKLISDNTFSDVYYSVNNVENQLTTESNIVYTGHLATYGNDGDYVLNKIKVYSKSNENINFKVVVEYKSDDIIQEVVNNDSEQ